MHHLNLYHVKYSYTDELRKEFPTIRQNSDEHRETYVGVLVNINQCNYIAPITHITKKSNLNQIPINIKNKYGDITNHLGTILFHNMIPVYENKKDPVYKLLDLKSIKKQNIQEYNKFTMQLRWINQNKNTILEKASETYKASIDKTHKSHRFIKDVLKCDFKALEDKMLEIKQKDLNKSISTNKEALEKMDVNELQKIYNNKQQNKKEKNVQKNSELEL